MSSKFHAPEYSDHSGTVQTLIADLGSTRCMHKFVGGRCRRSAELHSAVSPICNRQNARQLDGPERVEPVRNIIPRYGRLKICSTNTDNLWMCSRQSRTPGKCPNLPEPSPADRGCLSRSISKQPAAAAVFGNFGKSHVLRLGQPRSAASKLGHYLKIAGFDACIQIR